MSAGFACNSEARKRIEEDAERKRLAEAIEDDARSINLNAVKQATDYTFTLGLHRALDMAHDLAQHVDWLGKVALDRLVNELNERIAAEAVR